MMQDNWPKDIIKSIEQTINYGLINIQPFTSSLNQMTETVSLCKTHNH